MIVVSTLLSLTTSHSCQEDNRELLCNPDGTYKERQFRGNRRTIPICVDPLTGGSAGEGCFTKCDNHTREASIRAGGRGLVCDKDGNFKEYQCLRASECWCVDAETGSRQAWDICKGTKKMTCPEKYRHIFKSRPVAMLPTCDSDDNYTARQCDKSTGDCFCVDPVSGMRTSETDCLSKPCEEQASETGYLCTEEGDYFPRQCSQRDGVIDLESCFCVDPKTGEKVETTDCLVTQCEKDLASVDENSFYTPVCQPNGLFEKKQCRSASDCWCVFEDSGMPHFDASCLFTNCENERRHAARSKVKDSVRCTHDGKYFSKKCERKGRTEVCHCVDEDTNEKIESKKCLRTPCEVARDEAVEQNSTGVFVPSCTPKGDYEYKQCTYNNTSCWCSSPDGKRLTQDRDCLLTKCQYAAKTAGSHDGAFVPQCDQEGNYVTKQCHENIKLCWCVDPDGQESEDQSCIQTPCERERDRLMKIPKAWSPHCTPAGHYNHKQCRSSGGCWCVNMETGEKDPSDKTCFDDEL